MEGRVSPALQYNQHSAPATDLTALCLYQHYLRRLHRLHHNYVKAHCKTRHQQPPRQKPPPNQHTALLPSHPRNKDAPHRCTAAQICLSSQLQHNLTAVNLKAKARQSNGATAINLLANSSRSKTLPLTLPGNHGNFRPNSQPTVFPPIPNQRAGTRDNTASMSEESGKVLGLHDPIYIPCGREHSEIRMLKLRMKEQRERDRGGAWSFRTWKSMRELSGSLDSM